MKTMLIGAWFAGIALYLASLALAGSATGTYFRAMAGIAFGASSSVYIGWLWLNRVPISYQGGLDPRARPIRYHLGMLVFTLASLALLAASVSMFNEALARAR